MPPLAEMEEKEGDPLQIVMHRLRCPKRHSSPTPREPTPGTSWPGLLIERNTHEKKTPLELRPHLLSLPFRLPWFRHPKGRDASAVGGVGVPCCGTAAPTPPTVEASRPLGWRSQERRSKKRKKVRTEFQRRFFRGCLFLLIVQAKRFPVSALGEWVTNVAWGSVIGASRSVPEEVHRRCSLEPVP